MGGTKRYKYRCRRKTEEGIKEDSELEGPWTIWGPMVLAEEFCQLT